MKNNLLLTGLGVAAFLGGLNAQTVTTFSFTGGQQTFTVPNCVNTITVQVMGAQGANGAVGGNSSTGGTGGLGASVQGVISVTPGTVMFLNVGGQGATGTGGFNGGGNGGSQNAGGGGGASDIRLGGTTLNDRIVVAGGGGGGGRGGCEPAIASGGNGGAGGGGNGNNGFNVPTPFSAPTGSAGGGAGGTGVTGGAAGIGCAGFLGTAGVNGILGQGGNGGNGQSCCCFNAQSIPGGGGGGGGYNGGGGGGGGSAGTPGCSGNDKGAGGGGAGGSNFFSAVFTNTTATNGVQSGNGLITISYNTFPVVSVTAVNNTVCANSPAVLNASGATTYSWSSGATGASATVTPAANTVYTVTGTTSGCTDTKTIAVATLPSPTVTLTPGAPSACIGTTVNIAASGASSYTWSTGSNATSITPTISASANVFTISGTGANGCKGTAATTITALANPTVNVTSNSATICIGSQATLTANGAQTYSWNTGASTAVVAVSPSVSTTYTVVGTAGNGCKSTTTFVQSVTSCVGLNELTQSNGDITVSPNPATKWLTVKTNLQASEVVIINVAGKEIMRKSITSEETEINVSGLANGIYFVKINNSLLKFIKE